MMLVEKTVMSSNPLLCPEFTNNKIQKLMSCLHERGATGQEKNLANYNKNKQFRFISFFILLLIIFICCYFKIVILQIHMNNFICDTSKFESRQALQTPRCMLSKGENVFFMYPRQNPVER